MAAIPTAFGLILGSLRPGSYRSMGGSPHRFTKPPFEGCPSRRVRQNFQASQEVSGESAKLNGRFRSDEREAEAATASLDLLQAELGRTRRTTGSPAMVR